MAFNIGSLTAAQQIQLVYTAYFGRAAEPNGFGFWTPLLEENLDGAGDGNPGVSLDVIATEFFNQAETREVYNLDPGVTSTTDLPSPFQFLLEVYLNLFGRAPDPDGVNFWSGVLESGTFTIGEVIVKIVEGAQAADQQALLNRIEAGLDWKDAAEAAGVDEVDPINPDANYDAAVNVLKDVTNDPQTLADAKTATDEFFNEAPTAANESDSTAEDTALNGDVSDKTDDADGDTPLTHSVEPGDGPANGTVAMNADGTYTYTPNANYNGADSFTYTVNDGKGGTDTGTVFLTVNSVNDAPVAQTGIVSTTAEDTAVNGSVSSSDVDGDTPSYSVASGPANGSVTMNPDGTYTYTPDADFNGTDSFAYTVNDGKGGTDTAVVNITINPVDDAPVAQDESTTATEDGAVVNGQLDADDIDNNNASITFALNGAAPAGLTVNANGTYTFDPSVPAYQNLAAGQVQVVVAGYTATSNGKSDTGTITVTVTGTNDAPVATAVAVAGVEDTVAAGLAVATDVDNGDTLTYSVAPGDGPSNGGVTMNQNGSFEYTPDANFNGVDTFTYTVTDSQGATSTATVTVTVAAATDELTVGVDNFQGSVADDTITGNEATLNPGDSVNGNDGNDTLIVNVNTAGAINFAGFEAHVETFRTTIDGTGSATFDMSGSEITGNTFINANSTADVIYDRVNVNPDGSDADTRTTQLDVELRNVTQGASTTFTTRPAEVVAGDDEANVLFSNLDNNAHVGALSFFGTPGNTSATPAPGANSGIEVFDLSVMGSPLGVFLDDLNTPGGTTVNIATDTGPGAAGLTIGDTDIPGNVAASTSTNLAAGTATGTISGFDNALSNTIVTVTSSGDGDVALSLQDDTDASTNPRGAGVTGTFGGGDDTILGSQLNDALSGGDGNDILNGAGANDSLLGQGGNDLLIGDDSALGAPGADTLRGGEGQDTLLGGGADDRLFGDADNDLLFGATGNDSLEGGDGNDTISTGDAADNSNETVDGGAGNDVVYTRGEQLVGSNPTFFTPKADVLSGGADTDTLIVTGSSGNPNGMNDVTQFETINLNTGNHNYVIDNGSAFDNDTTSVTVDGSDAQSFGGNNTGTVSFNAATLSRAITLIGGDNNDTLIGGTGDDTIAGDGDNGGSNGGSDSLVGGLGNDTFLTNSFEMTGADTISGDGGTDKIVVQSHNGTGTINNNVTGIETLEVEQNGSGDFTLNITNNFTNNGTTLHVDGGALTNDALIVNHNVQSENKLTDVDIQITGGALNDTFNMGETLDAGDTIDGGAGNGDTLIVGSVSNTADADLTNVSNTEVLKVTGAGGGTITLGQAAFDAGITTVDASMASGAITINASNFPGPLTIIDGSGNSTILGPNSNPLTLQLNGGNDNVTTGSADDVIQIDNGDLTGNDSITDNGGNDTVELQNVGGAAVGAVVNLTNVTGIENYDFATNGQGFGSAAHSITFQGGNVGTVTDININGATVTDGADSLTVVIDGVGNGGPANTVDVDYRFTITGTAGNDRLDKANDGLANQISFDGGAGSDTVAINDGDLGGTTTIDGGTGIDWLSQTGGSWTDDDFINVSNVEGLTAESPLVATLGANAAAAGIDRIRDTSLNENVLLDAAFTNDLMVDLRQGGDDTINGGASAAALTFFGRSASNDITVADVLTGGTGTNDSILVDFNGTGTTDLSNTNGVEVVNITESSSGTFTLVLGNTTNDNANNLLTINETSSPNSFFGTGGNSWDGETFNVNGANYNGAILLNGQVGGGGATGNITTSNTGSFNDTINAADGNDTVSTNGGNDVVDGGTGNDNVDAGAGNDSVDGGTGSDNLTGNTGNDTVNGGANDDTVDGGAGIDVLDGGDGSDLIIGGGNEESPMPAVNQGDRMTGGNGNDTFRFIQVSDSAGLDHDVITDFSVDDPNTAAVEDQDIIQIETNVLVQAGGGATSVAFAGNAPNFAQAQGTIAATAGDGVADYVFQAGNAVEAPTLWIDVNDDGALNGQDLQIELEGFAGSFVGGEVILQDNIAAAAPTIDSITSDTGASPSDFITNDDGTDATQPVVRVSFNTTAVDGTAALAGNTLVFTGLPGGSTIGGLAAAGYALTAGDIANGFVDVTLGAAPVGNFSATMTVAINDGTSTGTAAAQAIVIDVSAPATPVVSLNSDTGQSAADEITNDNQVNVANLEGGTTTWEYSLDGGVTWTAGTGTSFDLTDDTIFAAGDVQVRQTDAAGNTSAVGQNGVQWEEDSAAPAAPTISLNSDTGTSGTDKITNDNAVNVAGLEPTATWEFSLDGGTTWNPGAGASFNMTSDTTYAAGDIQVRQTDVAGNTSAVGSNTNVWVEDSTPPSTNVTSGFYSSTGGTGNGFIQINGTFDTNDAVDGTQLTLNDGDGGTYTLLAADIDGAIVQSGTQITVNLTAAGLTAVQGATDMGDDSGGNHGDPTIDLGAGFFTDLAGNASGADPHNHIALNIRASDDNLTSLVGDSNHSGPQDDTFELDNTGVQATGNGGADTFILTDDGTNAFPAGGAGGQIGDINDFNATEGDTIQFEAAALNGTSVALTGVFAAGVGDGGTVAFRTFEENGNAPNDNTDAVTATTLAGTFIWDDINDVLRFDVSGDTSFNGFVVQDASGDDITIDLTGINGDVSAGDISFI